MPGCKSCGAHVPLSQWDLFTRCCLDCAAARKDGVTVEKFRSARLADRERDRREWLEALVRYYSTTKEWPSPQRDDVGRFKIPNDRFSRVVLTLGQIVALIACASTLVGVFRSWAVAGHLKASFPGVDSGALQLWIVLTGMASFVFWLAVFFAFGRAKWVVRLVECQQALVAELFGRAGGGGVPPAGEPSPGGREPPREPDGGAVEEPPPEELVLAVAELLTTLGGWILVKCATGDRPVPKLSGGERVVIRRADGTEWATTVEATRLLIIREPGRLAFTLAKPASLADVAGAVEVRITVPRRA